MRYRGIDGFPAYLVTDQGTVISGRDMRDMKPYPDSDGYPCLKLYPGNGKRVSFRVHRLVMEAFNGPRPDEHDCIRHLNGDCADARLCNLQYGTHQENYDDSIEHGTRNVRWFCLKT